MFFAVSGVVFGVRCWIATFPLVPRLVVLGSADIPRAHAFRLWDKLKKCCKEAPDPKLVLDCNISLVPRPVVLGSADIPRAHALKLWDKLKKCCKEAPDPKFLRAHALKLWDKLKKCCKEAPDPKFLDPKFLNQNYYLP